MASLQAAPVDFANDVQPIFREYCYNCHGPSQQSGKLRLDRRRDAMRGGNMPSIAPGTAAVWKYRAIYLNGDEQFGQWSDPVSIAVQG